MGPAGKDFNLRVHLSVASVAIGVLFIIPAVSPCSAQEGPRLEKVEVVGLKRLTQEQVVASSGLQLGQTIDRGLLQAAVDKMMKSRLYASVGFRVSTDEDKSTVTFEIVESNKPTPAATPKTRPRTTRRRPHQ